LFFNRWKSRVKESRRSQSFAACLDFAQSPRAHREHDALSESAKKRKKSAEEEKKFFGERRESAASQKKRLNVHDNTQVRAGTIRTITDRTERFNEIRRD